MNSLDILQPTVLVVALNLEISILAVNLGTRIRKPEDKLLLALIFALFHCAVTLSGFALGSALSSLVGTVGRYIGSFVLILVGGRLTFKSRKSCGAMLSASNTLLILFGAGMEDLAAGIGLGAFGGNASILVLLFFLISVPMNMLAFRVGRDFSKSFTLPVDLITGLLLIGIGLLSVFGIL